MKDLTMNLLKLLIVWLVAVLIIASCSNQSYAVDLSKHISVTPQRHCGFFASEVRPYPQYGVSNDASVSATQTRLYTLYEGMTRQNKSAMANMSGGSNMPRVNPLTLISQISVNLNSKILGGFPHA